MRDNVIGNALLNQTFIVCAEIISKHLIHQNNSEAIANHCNKIPSTVVSNYLFLGLNMIDCAYIPEYINAILLYEYEKFDKTLITQDELKVLVFLNCLMTKVFQKHDLDFFYEFYSHECPSDVRDQILIILNPQN